MPFKILDYWIQDRFQLSITENILKEYERTLISVSKGEKEQLVSNWLILIAKNSHVIRIKRRLKLLEDPDDDKFIECAVAGIPYTVNEIYLLIFGNTSNNFMCSIGKGGFAGTLLKKIIKPLSGNIKSSLGTVADSLLSK